METSARVHTDDAVNKALAGDNPAEIYSMGHNAPKEHQPSRSFEMKGPEKKPEPTKQEQKKKISEIIYWRVGLGFAIIFIITGVIYFIGKGVNWGLGKVSGSAPITPYTSDLRSNADPSGSRPSQPVISNMNMIPVGGYQSTSANSNTAPSAAAGSNVLGATTSSGLLSNNCPAYTGNDYYYCEWIDQYTFRPYRSQAEYQAAHQTPKAASPPVSSGPVGYAPTPAPAAPYYPQTPPPGQTGGYLANGCPAYTGNEYAYCIWIDRYTFRGFRPGESAPSYPYYPDGFGGF